MSDLRVFILRGGLWGVDGPATSPGMDYLATQLPVKASVYNWSNYIKAQGDIRAAVDAGHRIALIGYSGGGSRATWIAQSKMPIDLMVLYDPSPRWQMMRIPTTVARCLCYYNTAPLMMGLGGGLAEGHNVEVYKIAQQHLAVQANPQLHAITEAAVKELL